ncbi:MAG TPA: hypothetical protein VOA00_07590 [Thermoanaerobaculia bacterium]|nr:hypothetical protein [Thermoanaerobaculia bacterium]
MSGRRAGRVFLVLGMAAALSAGCSRSKSRGAPSLPASDAVWFEEGVAEGAPETETELSSGGFGSVFLPAAVLVRDGTRWASKEAAPPPERPFDKLPVTLVISAGAEARKALSDPGTASALGDAAWLAARAAMNAGPRFGRVSGIHLDFPFAPQDALAYAAVLQALRAKLPRTTLLTWSLRFAPSQEQLPALRNVAGVADGAVAFVFGEGAAADPASTDGMGFPWLAGFAPAARGKVASAEGEEATLPERVLARLTDDARVEFANDMTFKEESASTFLLTPREALAVGDFRFQPEEKIRFRQPSLSDMIYRLGAGLAGRRHFRGRVVLVSGRREADRIFTVAALNDILLGHPLDPDLRVSIGAIRGGVTLAAENPTPHASLVSRLSNWVEVDLPGADIVDVKPGGFDRYEVFGPQGEPVTLRRGVRLRFFETLVGPFEKIEPATILMRHPPADGCCAHRIHVASSTGAEVAREGNGTETTPRVPSAR